MQVFGPGVHDPLFGIENQTGRTYRPMSVEDVNELVALMHQPYMYERQRQRMLKRFDDLDSGLTDADSNIANQEAVAVLRFALQSAYALSRFKPKDASELVRFALSVGNKEKRKLYRGEMSLEFFSGEEAPSSRGGTLNKWLEYRVRISNSYRTTLWADFARREASNEYFPNGFLVDACAEDGSGETVNDLFSHEGDCFAVFRVGGIEKNTDGHDLDFNRAAALYALVDYLATLHLSEVELCVMDGRIVHQTNTLIAQAWRVAFEALSEMTSRNDKYGKRKLKYKVICCADCKSPRIVKQGKNAIRCPLCSNNNTKSHKSEKRRVY